MAASQSEECPTSASHLQVNQMHLSDNPGGRRGQENTRLGVSVPGPLDCSKVTGNNNSGLCQNTTLAHTFRVNGQMGHDRMSSKQDSGCAPKENQASSVEPLGSTF